MTKKIRVMTIFGTRPEAIKMAPLVKELEKNSEYIDSVVCVTAQHREMLDQVLRIFDITPDYDLNIMHERQTLVNIATRALEGLDGIMKKDKPDLVLVHRRLRAALRPIITILPSGMSKRGLGHMTNTSLSRRR